VSDHNNPYRRAAVEQAWRLAALADRNPHSPTRGSFSRTHWAWKFSDFPYPRMQEGVHALVRLYELDEPGNPLFGAHAVEPWIEWGFEYWTALQHDNGAYDEAYPFEQCLAATAFTSFYLGAAFARWRTHLTPALARRVAASLARAGDWLCTHDETHGVLSNHLGVAVAALEQSARMFDAPRFSARARVFLERILEHQSAEGWMREYDGADIGYGTHGFFYLAVYWKMTGCERTRDALDRFATFLSFFVHPDGTIGGEYGSRNTEFYYPAGFELMAAVSPASASIAAGLRDAVRDRRVCGVWSMDDFNLMPMLNNLFFAGDAVDEGDGASARPLPWQSAPFRRYFSDAGLWIVNTPNYYAISAVSKGGTVSLFDKLERRLGARHSGLVAVHDSERFTTQDHTLSPPVAWSSDADVATFSVAWKSLGTTVFSTPLFLAFRLFTVTAGRVPAVSQWVKDLLVKVLIRRKRRAPIEHQRRLTATDEGIDIVDELTLPWSSGELQAAEQFTAIHMGSSLYADARTFRSTEGVVAWPLAPRVRLCASLTRSGAAWRREDA
jgi:hypothetical protein